MAPNVGHIDTTPACIRRRSTFFSNKNIQEPTLKSVKCRLYCRTNYYLNINAKGNIAGIRKRDLKDKFIQNKKERDMYDLEMEQEEKRFRVPTGFESKDDSVRISQTAAINDILKNHQNAGAKNLKLPQKQHQRRLSESSNRSTNSPKNSQKQPQNTPNTLNTQNNSQNTSKHPQNIKNSQKLPPSPLSQKQPFKQQQPNTKKPINRLDEDGNDIEAMFYLIPVGLRVVAIQHVATENYIAMDIFGKLYPSQTYTVECKFKEACVETSFIVYSSTCWLHPTKQRGLHIGINEMGHVGKGTKYSKIKDGAHFTPEPLKVVWLKEPGEDVAGQQTNSKEKDDKNKNFGVDSREESSVSVGITASNIAIDLGGIGIGSAVPGGTAPRLGNRNSIDMSVFGYGGESNRLLVGNGV